MSDNVYYEKPVLLDRVKHRNCRVRPTASYAFARKANSLFIAAAEFPEAFKEYPIVFSRQAGGRIVPLAMLGLRARENLFVDEEERWTASYVPAFVRRYPFVLAELEGSQLGVCIDEAFTGLNETEGEPLFDATGADTPLLKNALDFLGRYQQEYVRTDLFCQRLDKAGVLREMNAKADLVDGRSFTVGGLLVVDEAMLMALPDATVLELFRAGEMHLVSMHLASLSNMKKLVDRVAERQSPIQPAPKPA